MKGWLLNTDLFPSKHVFLLDEFQD